MKHIGFGILLFGVGYVIEVCLIRPGLLHSFSGVSLWFAFAAMAAFVEEVCRGGLAWGLRAWNRSPDDALLIGLAVGVCEFLVKLVDGNGLIASATSLVLHPLLSQLFYKTAHYRVAKCFVAHASYNLLMIAGYFYLPRFGLGPITSAITLLIVAAAAFYGIYLLARTPALPHSGEGGLQSLREGR